jgi:hypothetical protein
MKNLVVLFGFLILVGCTDSQEHSKNDFQWQQINGRDEGIPDQRTDVYRATVPPNWEREAPSPDRSIEDTTLPNCSFMIRDEDDHILITIHTFPSDHLEERIPPEAQVSRWKKQFKEIDQESMSIIPKAYGGFAGLFFEASGKLKDNADSMTVLAWSMQLDPQHYQTLSLQSDKQRCADYTIKAVGSTELIEKHKDEIHHFAKSFELITPIPAPQ